MAKGLGKHNLCRGRGPHRVAGAWPCQQFSAETAEDRGLHRWHATVTLGCYACEGCGVVGVCPGCYAGQHHLAPRLPLTMRCAAHRRQGGLGEHDEMHYGMSKEADAGVNQGAATSATLVGTGETEETRASGADVLLAARWARMLQTADEQAAAYAADLTSPLSERIVLRRQVKWVLDAAERFQHALSPVARRLAREALWRRDHAGAARMLPMYASAQEGLLDPYAFRESFRPPDARRVSWAGQPGDYEGRQPIFRRDWERCECPVCRLARRVG